MVRHQAFTYRTIHTHGTAIFYLLLAGGVEEPVAAGQFIMARANASIAIYQVPFSRFRILNQLPCMILSLT